MSCQSIAMQSKELFQMPQPKSKEEFMNTTNRIRKLVSMVLAPCGISKNLLGQHLKQSNDMQRSFQDVLEVISEVIYEHERISESIMAVTVHELVDELKDVDVTQCINLLNDTLSRIFDPPRFIEVPSLSMVQLQDIINKAHSLVKTSLQLLSKRRNSAVMDEIEMQEKRHSESTWRNMYPAVVHVLGFKPPPNNFSRESSFRLKSKIRAIGKSLLTIIEEYDIDLEQLQALLDSVPQESQFIQQIEEIRTRTEERWNPLNTVVLDLPKVNTSKAEFLFNCGRFDESIETYSALLNTLPVFHPSTGSIFSAIAECHLQLGKTKEAMHYCELSIQVSPECSSAYLCRGNLREKNQDMKGALEDYITAFTLDGSRTLEQAQIVERMSKLIGSSIAKVMFTQRKALDSLPSLWAIQSYFDSFKNESLPTAEDYAASPLLKVVVDAKKSKDYQASYDALQQLIGLSNETDDIAMAIALNYSSSFLYLIGDLSGALEAINKSIALDGQIANSYVKRGGILCEMGEFEEALHNFQSALAIDPTDMDIYLHRGQMHLIQNEYREAINDLRRCVDEKENALPMAHAIYGMALYKNGSKKLALNVNRKALEYFPESMELLLFYGEILTDSGNYAEGISMFRKASLLCPDCPLPYLNAGRAFVTTNDPYTAISHFEYAMTIDERCSSAHLDLAQLYFAQGRTTEAFNHYQRASQYARFLPELDDVCSCMEAAKAQLCVTDRLGVELRHIMKAN